MNVNVWHFQQAPQVWISSYKDIVDAIERNGNSVAYINTTIVNGHYYILGGRKSITTALSQVNGEFQSTVGTLSGEMVRFSTGIISKTYTVIHLTDQPLGRGGLDIKGWNRMTIRGRFAVGGIKSAVPFKEVLTQMRSVDAQMFRGV